LIILICGLPGAGKTTLARELAVPLKGVVLSTDKIRKELIPRPTYSRKEREMIYDVLLLLAKYLYEAGINCILDGTFNKKHSRDEVKNFLKLSEKQLITIECICPEEVVMTRLTQRKGDYSDADFKIYKRMQKIFEPVDTHHITVDCRYSPRQNAKFVIEKMKKDERQSV
jgi:predicted kinase